MRAIRRCWAVRCGAILIGLGIASGFLLTLSAYDYYENINSSRQSNNCASCHEPPAVTPSGFIGRGDLHRSHQAFATNTCGLCHTQTGDVPRLDSSDQGISCIGCHGQPLGAGATSGAGLRLHHSRAGVPADADGNFCVTCHTNDPVPPPESAVPPYYGRIDVLQTDPCNADGAEDFWNRDDGATSDGVGLDNDGDLLADAADPDCGVAPPEVANAGFSDPQFPQRLTWDPQDGGLYDVIRSDGPQFLLTSALTACLEQATPLNWSDDTGPVPLGGVLFYLVRNTLAQDYGAMSDGTPRDYTVCP